MSAQIGQVNKTARSKRTLQSLQPSATVDVETFGSYYVSLLLRTFILVNRLGLTCWKAPLKLKHIWTIRVRLELADRARELALFNLAIDSKLRSCDLLKLRVRDVYHGDRVAPRAIILQQKTQRPVQFEITEQTRDSLSAWIRVGPKTGSVHGLTVQPAEIGLITRVCGSA